MWPFTKKIHVHLHIEGPINLNINGAVVDNDSIKQQMKKPYEERKVEDVVPDMETIDIPDIEFGDTV